MRSLGCLVLAAFGAVGVLVAVPPVWVWTLLGLLWMRLLVREGWRIHRGYVYDDKIDNPSPPPPRVSLIKTEPQVETFGNGAGHIVYPAGHVRRYDT